MRRFGTFWLAAALLFSVAVPSTVLAARKAPPFNLERVEGGRLALKEILGEGPVLINFWATWCKPCMMEAPHLVELHERYAERGLRVVGISLDNVNSVSKVKKTAKKLKLPYPVLLDTSNQYARRLQVASLPTNVLLDKEGNIVRTFIGYRAGDEKEIAREVEKLLGDG